MLDDKLEEDLLKKKEIKPSENLVEKYEVKKHTLSYEIGELDYLFLFKKIEGISKKRA